MIKNILIRPTAKKNLIEEVSKVNNLETGGFLCGHYKEEYIIIESASGPGPNAIHSVVDFTVDKPYVDQYLNKEYANSKGLNIYVGEWHTHPQAYPQPSEQDLMSIYERTIEWQHGEIVFLIIGFIGFTAEKIEEQIVCICYNKSKNSFFKLPVQFVDNQIQ